MPPKVLPYGSWTSPITEKSLVGGAAVPGEVTVDGGEVYWIELSPKQGGRYGLWALRDGEVQELVREPFNVRTRVHEYGGGSYLVHGQTVYFSNFADQLVYRFSPGSDPVPMTRPGLRYADYVLDKGRNRLVGICEDHTVAGRLPTNTVATLGLDGAPARTLASGNDFYSSPRIDPTGRKLAWVTWNFPEMPWDGTELWVGEFAADGSIARKALVAGGKEESVINPEWSPDGVLHFLSDKSGFWNLYRWEGKAEKVWSMDAVIGRPQWGFRMSAFDFDGSGRIVFSFCREGTWNLGLADSSTGRMKSARSPYSDISSLRASGEYAYFIGGSPTEPPSVVRLGVADGKVRVIRRPKVPPFRGFLSMPKHVKFTTTGGKKAYALLYLPSNRGFRGPKGMRPPLIVQSHGGPTSQAASHLDLGIQYWTSRGFAFLDVNYGGSSGYGREYRMRLIGIWGVVDVDDCCNGARAMAKLGLVDGRRLIIRGGSAGGYTTLCALAFRKTFMAGASYFGVSDAEALAKDTHKFESRYGDNLIAPYPERKDTYYERSPIHFVDNMSSPIIFFQGKEDVVVPPAQAERMVASLKKRGVPVAYLAFEGEQHGFRKAETIIRTRKAELYFYSRVFGFPVPAVKEPVKIWNLAPEKEPR